MTEEDPNMLSERELRLIKTWLQPGPLLPEIRDDMRALFVHIDAQAAEIYRLKSRSLNPSGNGDN